MVAAQYDSTYIPERGHVVWLHFNPQAGTEMRDHHPALVLSPWAFNDSRGLAVVCPITSRVRAGNFVVAVPEDEDLDVHGVILADQVKSLDWRERRAVFKAKMPDDTVDDVAEIVETIVWGE